MAFLRTILIIFIIYYVIRFFIRFVFPSLLFKYMGNKMKDFSQQQEQQKQRARKREGEVSIDYAPPAKPDKNKPDKGGEYIDYVEVKD